MSQTQMEHRPSSTGRRNAMAGWALALSIVTLGGIGSVLGIVLGVKARERANAEGRGGAGMATAAIVVGVITLVLSIGYWILVGQHTGGTGGGGSGGGTTGGGGTGGY